jgi:hypothetical protein
MRIDDLELIPKSELPVTHAVLWVKMVDGEPQTMAAVEFLGNSHRQAKGPVSTYCTDFLKAASLVSWLTFKEELNRPEQAEPITQP